MSKREEILQTSLRPSNLTDLKNIFNIETEDSFEIVRHVISNEKAYVLMNLLDEMIHAVIGEDEICFILQQLGYIDEFDVTSCEVTRKAYNWEKDDYETAYAPVEYFFNDLDSETVKEILFAYAENNLDCEC